MSECEACEGTRRVGVIVERPRGWTNAILEGIHVGFIRVPMRMTAQRARERILRPQPEDTGPELRKALAWMCEALAAAVRETRCPWCAHV